jgi:uncharacterized repeat protein (TIGR02543 family)
VFVRNGITWTQQAYLKASNTRASRFFGRQVSVSGDTAVVGSPLEDSSAPDSGAAYVFVRNGTTWTQQAHLKASNAEASDKFGYSVAISGNAIVIGAKEEDSGTVGVNGDQSNNTAPDSGAAYVFVRNGTTWAQQAYLKASNTGISERFGRSVAVSGDTVVVGADYENSSATGVNGDQSDNSSGAAGAAYVFVRNGATWVQQSYLKASNTGADDQFGSSVAVSGETVVIGASAEESSAIGVDGDQADNSASSSGAAYVFVRSGTTWTQQAYLKASNTGADDWFGHSVSVDGDTVVVGARAEDSNATGVDGDQSDNSVFDSGSAYVFTGLRIFSLSVSGDHGTVDGEGEYELGTTANLTASPDPGYLFTGWTDDASGSDNPLSVLMDSDKTIGATFEPDLDDDDGDGLTNYQEGAIYGTDPDLPDTDGDGLTDAYEVGIGRYTLVLGVLTWDQARADAETQGGYLGTFTSQEEWDIALTSLGEGALDGVTGAWIGATDADVEGSWTWITGEAFTFDVWASGQPDDFNNSDVAEVSGGFGAALGQWFDTGASVFRDAYILEIDYSTDPTVADTDGDGLNDGEEAAAGTNPFLSDTDGDGLTDSQEINLTLTDPTLPDTDGNGTGDGAEDLDSDGLNNLAEVNTHGTDPRDDDSDDDGVNDGDEVSYDGSTFTLVEGGYTWPQAAADASSKGGGGRVAVFPEAADYGRVALDVRKLTTAYLWIGLSDEGAEGTWLWGDEAGTPLDYDRWLAGQPDGGAAESHVAIFENETTWVDAPSDFVAGGYVLEFVGLNPNDPDSDGDGLSDGEELNSHGSSPVDADTDRDGLPDGDEVNTHGSSPTKTDTDDDGLTDYVEVTVYGSNPALKDSDSDGFDDLFEVETGFDPASGTSTPEAYSEMLIAVEFRFNAAADVTYKIESSTDLENWELVEGGIVGVGDRVTKFYTTEATPKRYFRARRE